VAHVDGTSIEPDPYDGYQVTYTNKSLDLYREEGKAD